MNFVIIFGYTVIYSTFQVIWFTFSEPIHNDHSRFGPCIFKLFCNILVDLWCCSLIFYIDWCRTKWVLTFKGSPKLLNSIWMLLVRSFTNKSLDVCHLSLRITSGLSIFHWFFFSRCTESARACRRQDEQQHAGGKTGRVGVREAAMHESWRRMFAGRSGSINSSWKAGSWRSRNNWSSIRHQPNSIVLPFLSITNSLEQTCGYSYVAWRLFAFFWLVQI